MTGRPTLTAFLKKMRANDSATTATTPPASRRATTACSRDDPQPMFLPATMTDPRMRPASVGSRSSKTCSAQTERSFVRR